jgi:hypothetical protein
LATFTASFTIEAASSAKATPSAASVKSGKTVTMKKKWKIHVPKGEIEKNFRDVNE